MFDAYEDPVPAEIAFTGTWSVEASTGSDTCTFALRYPLSASNVSAAFAFADLGLSRQRLDGAEREIAFAIRRDAGTFACEGTVARGHGRGAFRFRPDPAYAAALVEAGLRPLTPQKHVKAGMFDLTLSFVSAILATGLPRVTFADLLTLKIFRNSPEDVHALHAAFPNAEPDELATLGMLGVTRAYVDALRRAHVRDLSSANVSALRASGINQSFIEALPAGGYRDLTIDELVALHRTG